MSTPGYGPPDPEGEKYGTPPQAPQPGTPAGYPSANPGGYPPPGPGGYPPPGYPGQQGGYPPAGYPAQQGGYPPAGYPGQQGGYPPAGYPGQQGGYPGQQGGYPGQQGGYPPGNQFMPGGLVRPGPIMASAVIGYVLSGFLFIAGLILLASASTVEDLVGGLVDTSGLALLGLGDVIAGGLLIAGGVAVSGGKINGRIMTSAAAGICVLCGLRWLSIDGSTIAWVIGFCAPALLATFFLWQKPSSQWLASRSVR